MPRLQAHLGPSCPQLWIKRDDCTGLALGGNKVRKLEYLVADALRQGADVLVTEGGVQSNHCRQTAAAAAKLGLGCVVVLSGPEPDQATGNLLLDHLLGARVVHVATPAERAGAGERIERELRAEGRKPYVIPTGGSNGLGALGYVTALVEMLDQADERGIVVDAIVTASGSGGTQGGLVAGVKLLAADGQLGHEPQVIGISDGEPKAELARMVERVVEEAGEVLGQPIQLDTGHVVIHDEYAGPGYGMPTPEMVEAIRLVATLEGVVLDPVYTGKAMAGMLNLTQRRRWRSDDSIVFLHSGGAPSVFGAAGAAARALGEP